MADQEKWGLSREEIDERLRNLKQKKNEPTRGGRSSGQGVKLLYIRDYLYHHATREHPQNANAIQAFLASKGIEASTKTIYNDILRLQEDFGVPIEYNTRKWGYYITEPEFKPYELRLMVDSIQSSKFITQAEARTISQKIIKLADVYTRPSLTDRHAWVSDRVRSANDDVVREADRIHAAIANNRKIKFRYFHYTPNRANSKKYSKNGDFITVSPYAMLWDNGNYYLYAYTEKGVFRTFRIDRMERISNPLQEERDGEKEFKAEAITAKEYKVFQMFHGEQVKVRVRFSNHLADAVIDQFGKIPFLCRRMKGISLSFCPWSCRHPSLRGLRLLDGVRRFFHLRPQLIKCGILSRDVLTCITMKGRSKNFSPFDIEMMADDTR